jgi:protein-disulfide isomerase
MFTAMIAFTLIATSAAAADPPVATVGNKSISRADLDKKVAPQLMEVEQQRYEVLRQGLDELVAAALIEQEAAARKMKPEDLEKQEIQDKVPQPTDAEIQQVYDENKQALGGATIDQVKDRIVEFLRAQKVEARKQEYLGELKKKYKTTVSLKPPKVEVAKGSRPPLGKQGAPVTIVMFSDYECPFCKRSEATVDQVMDSYKDKVQLFYRDYPLPFHANARPASEAAHCANAQGKFWEYHKKLMASSDLSKASLQKLAGETGLDQKKFDQCLDSGTYKKDVEGDIAAGEAVGVDGTPAFFINGRRLSGAQPFEAFKEIIDEELAVN